MQHKFSSHSTSCSLKQKIALHNCIGPVMQQQPLLPSKKLWPMLHSSISQTWCRNDDHVRCFRHSCGSNATTTHWRAVMPNCLLFEKLKPAENWYSTFDWELLAIYLAIKHFWHFIEGCKFQVLTDYKPLSMPCYQTLTGILQRRAGIWTMYHSSLQTSSMSKVLTISCQMHCHA